MPLWARSLALRAIYYVESLVITSKVQSCKSAKCRMQSAELAALRKCKVQKAECRVSCASKVQSREWRECLRRKTCAVVAGLDD